MSNMTSVFRVFVMSGMLLALVLQGCEKQRLNPLDPGGAAFEMPGLTFLSAPGENAVLNADSITVAWAGNFPICDYKYTLTNLVSSEIYYSSPDWVRDSVVTFLHLDDGPYEFTIAAKYEGLDTTSSYSRRFVVQTGSPPDLVFMRKYTSKPIGNEFEIDVWGEGLKEFLAGDFSIGFDPGAVRFVGVGDGDLKDSAGVQQVSLFDYGSSDPISAANQTGVISVSTMYLAKSGGGNISVSGTGSVLKLIFQAERVGSSQISFLNVDLRNANGDSLSVQTSEPATVAIVEGQ